MCVCVYIKNIIIIIIFFLSSCDILNFFLSVIHSLMYFYTSSYGVSSFPEFVTVGLFDGTEISYYDSNNSSVRLKQDWMKKVTADEPHYLQNEYRKAYRSQMSLQKERENLMQRFNHTGG